MSLDILRAVMCQMLNQEERKHMLSSSACWEGKR